MSEGRVPLGILAEKEQEMRTWHDLRAQLLAHEARCDERWKNQNNMFASIDTRLNAQTADISLRGAKIYEKIDEFGEDLHKAITEINTSFNNTINKTLAWIVVTSFGFLAALLIFVVTHKWS